MLESRDNNNSLMHLKECVRAKAKMAQEESLNQNQKETLIDIPEADQ